jgi:hypothetical protein
VIFLENHVQYLSNFISNYIKVFGALNYPT